MDWMPQQLPRGLSGSMLAGSLPRRTRNGTLVAGKEAGLGCCSNNWNKKGATDVIKQQTHEHLLCTCTCTAPRYLHLHATSNQQPVTSNL